MHTVHHRAMPYFILNDQHEPVEVDLKTYCIWSTENRSIADRDRRALCARADGIHGRHKRRRPARGAEIRPLHLRARDALSDRGLVRLRLCDRAPRADR
ncbi:protein of unknown function [Burkholderia multivorans]